jgi:DNA-binding NarL/FixJ family response regulator
MTEEVLQKGVCFMDQRQMDKVLIIANGHGTGADSMIAAGAMASTPMKRNISLFEERVLRCVHHEFAAMTQEEAAIELNVSPMRISRALSDMEERAKTIKAIGVMFPILTKHQFEIYNCIVGRGLTAKETADELNLASASTVNTIVATLRTKGMSIPRQCDMPKPTSYSPSMDKDVREKY